MDGTQLFPFSFPVVITINAYFPFSLDAQKSFGKGLLSLKKSALGLEEKWEKNYVTILEDLTDKYTLYFIDFGYNFLLFVLCEY